MRALMPKGQESQTIPLPSTTGRKPDGRFVCPEPRCGKSYKHRLAFQSRHAGKTFTTADYTRVDENIDDDNRESPLLEDALEADTTVTVQEMEATPSEQNMQNEKRRHSGYQEQCYDGWPDLTWPDMETILTTSDYRATEDALKVGAIVTVQEMVVTPSEQNVEGEDTQDSANPKQGDSECPDLTRSDLEEMFTTADYQAAEDAWESYMNVLARER